MGQLRTFDHLLKVIPTHDGISITQIQERTGWGRGWINKAMRYYLDQGEVESYRHFKSVYYRKVKP